MTRLTLAGEYRCDPVAGRTVASNHHITGLSWRSGVLILQVGQRLGYEVEVETLDPGLLQPLDQRPRFAGADRAAVRPCDRQDRPRGGGEERLVGVEHIIDLEVDLLHRNAQLLRQLEDYRAGDPDEDRVVGRRDNRPVSDDPEVSSAQLADVTVQVEQERIGLRVNQVRL